MSRLRPMTLLLIGLLALGTALSGCGNKGPLYLPDGTPGGTPGDTENAK